MEFPMQTVIVILIILIAFAIFLMLISQWSGNSQNLLKGVFDFFGNLLKGGAPPTSPPPGSSGGSF
ncbi:MAG TPA: hypothetical protein VJB16_00635 [archaeon]|nr:hypothetical protein [archaeon]